MPIPVFNPPMRPSPGTGHAPEVKLRTAAFGDGYTQSSPAGINHIRQVVTFRWDYLTLAEAKEITSFFEERGGCKPFEYQLWGETAPRRWTCENWSITEGHPTRVTATFKQNFAGLMAPQRSAGVTFTTFTNEVDFDAHEPGPREIALLLHESGE